MNLIHDAWIPIRDSTGIRRIRPAELATSGAISVATPRPDFDAALLEFLIGLYQSTCPPRDEPAWRAWATSPPSAPEVSARLEAYAESFQLDHPETPFLQETSLSGEPPQSIADLLIDTPGGATVDDNKDLFIKRRLDHAYCPSCATLALYTLQAFAPAGGRGNMTSLRGGGPISSILTSSALWETVWSNVLPWRHLGLEEAPAGPDAGTFPWLSPADEPKAKRRKVFAADVPRLHAYWGMPRRILLAPPDSSGPCTLCGAPVDARYRSYSGRPYGLDYQGSWSHPLSPTQEANGEISARKGRPDLGGYREWIGLVAANADNTKRPAEVIQHFRRSKRARDLKSIRLRAGGYAMDNAKVEGWYEGTMPEPIWGDEPMLQRVDDHARHLVLATDEATKLLKSAIREAWFDRPREAKGDISNLAKPLWDRTQQEFHASLRRIVEDADASHRERMAWYRLLQHEALTQYESVVPYDNLGDGNPQRLIAAELKLRRLLRHQLLKPLDLAKEDIAKEIPA